MDEPLQSTEPGSAERAERGAQPDAAGELAVIVPLDGRDASMSALPVAREVAALAGATLHVVYVDPERAPDVGRLVEDLHLRPSDLNRVVLDPRAGAPAEQIVALARELCCLFIVLCPHADAASSSRRLGSTAEGILANAPCPVLFVPPGRGMAPWHFGSALVPHDGTPTSSGAIPPMVRLLQRAQAALWLLYVAKPGAAAPETGGLAVPHYVDQPQHEWPSWIHEFLARVNLEGFPGLRFAVAAGEPGTEIIRAAREHAVDMIVLGWRGTLATKRAAVLKKILAEAPCPVLVFRVH